jgi:hypothetical protein
LGRPLLYNDDRFTLETNELRGNPSKTEEKDRGDGLPNAISSIISE